MKCTVATIIIAKVTHSIKVSFFLICRVTFFLSVSVSSCPRINTEKEYSISIRSAVADTFYVSKQFFISCPKTVAKKEQSSEVTVPIPSSPSWSFFDISHFLCAPHLLALFSHLHLTCWPFFLICASPFGPFFLICASPFGLCFSLAPHLLALLLIRKKKPMIGFFAVCLSPLSPPPPPADNITPRWALIVPDNRLIRTANHTVVL